MTVSPMDRFTQLLDLHVPGDPLLIPNPWDAGSARILQGLGFRALATTSAGFAGSLGRPDGSVTRNEALSHASEIVAAVDIPVSADLENGFGDNPDEVAETVRLAAGTGIAGCSVEDWDPVRARSYASGHAAERVAAAAEAAHAGPSRLVFTARADAHLHGARDPDDLDETISRLLAYERAGADVLYAPAVSSVSGIRAILDAVALPVNVLALPDAPAVGLLAELGVARVSIGSGFFWAAMGGLVTAGRELLGGGTYAFWESAGPGRDAGRESFEATTGARPEPPSPTAPTT